jgi:DNA-binding response OmpR family regulator
MMVKNLVKAARPVRPPHPHHAELIPRRRILVAEDDAAIRRINTLVLTSSGYHVDAAEDGEAAWNALQRTTYDLLVTDNDMPKLTGVQLIQKLQAACMPIPVIMATGKLPPEDFSLPHQLQPAVTLLKPYSFEELVTAVKAVLRLAGDSLASIAPPADCQRGTIRTV